MFKAHGKNTFLGGYFKAGNCFSQCHCEFRLSLILDGSVVSQVGIFHEWDLAPRILPIVSVRDIGSLLSNSNFSITASLYCALSETLNIQVLLSSLNCTRSMSFFLSVDLDDNSDQRSCHCLMLSYPELSSPKQTNLSLLKSQPFSASRDKSRMQSDSLLECDTSSLQPSSQ